MILTTRHVKLFFITIVLLEAIAISIIQYNDHRGDVIRTDEAAWVFATVYWTHLIKGEFRHPDWQEGDALDHPPFGKYYYGAFLWLKGMNEQTIENKEWWLSKSGDELNRDVFRQGLQERIDEAKIAWARVAASATFIMFIIAMYILGTVLGSPHLGAFASLVASIHLQVLASGTLVMVDLLLLALVVLQTAATLLWMRSWIEDKGKKSLRWALVAGTVATFAALTKLNGLLCFGTLGIVTCITVFASADKRKIIIMQSIAAFLVALGFLYLLNPTFQNAPTALLDMIHWRAVEIKADEMLEGAAYMPLYDRLVIAFRAILFNSDWDKRPPLLPTLQFIFAVIGSIAGLRLVTKKNGPWKQVASIAFFAITLLWIIPTLWSFKKTLYGHYLLPLLPWIFLVQSLGINRFLGAARKLIKGKKNELLSTIQLRECLLAIIAAILAWNIITSVNMKESFITAYSNPILKINRIGNALVLHPGSRLALIEFVKTFIGIGRDDEALKAIIAANTYHQDDPFIQALRKVLEERLQAKSNR